MVRAVFCNRSMTLMALVAFFVLITSGYGCKKDTSDGSGPALPGAPGSVEALPATSHPAAAEREYAYIDKVWENDEERELVEYLSRAHTSEKAYRIIRKDPHRYLPMLRKSARAENVEVRTQSIIILGLLKRDNDTASTEVLKDAVLLDSRPEVRAIAAKAFVMYKYPGAAQVLIRSLNEDPYEGARANAAWALGEIGDPAAIPHLRKATSDDDTFVRLRSVGALMELRARKAIPELIERLSDRNAMVSERAHQALRFVTGTDKGRDPSEWRKVFGRPVEDNREPGSTAPDAQVVGGSGAASNGAE